MDKISCPECKKIIDLSDFNHPKASLVVHCPCMARFMVWRDGDGEEADWIVGKHRMIDPDIIKAEELEEEDL